MDPGPRIQGGYCQYGPVDLGRAQEMVYVPFPWMTDKETEAAKAEAPSRARRTRLFCLSSSIEQVGKVRPRAERYVSGSQSQRLPPSAWSFTHPTRTERLCPGSLYDDDGLAPAFWIKMQTLIFLAVDLRSLFTLFLSVTSSVKWAVRRIK